MSLVTLTVLAAAIGLLIIIYVVAVFRHRRNAPPPVILPVRYAGELAPRPVARPQRSAAFDAPAQHEDSALHVMSSRHDTPSAAMMFERSPRPPQRPPADDEAPAEGATIRFQRQQEEQVQLLPGRLEIEEGSNRGQEIRFVRVHGEPPEVTIGRGDGPPYRHIKLSARTVSRQHARLRFENGHWIISNLSKTNPTVVNGEELDDGADYRLLNDGDTIEMGEIVLRFRMG
jgi:pSer/pThr/pTyr-binding forkhead associated (FHA) protein